MVARPSRALGSPWPAPTAAKACSNVTPGLSRTSVGDATGSPETVDTTLTAPAGTDGVAVIDFPVIVSARVGNVPAAVAVAPLATAIAATTIPAVRAEMRFKR